MSSLLRNRLLSSLHAVPGLTAVEKLIQEKFSSEVKILSEIPDYLFAIGGKRMRPIICLLTAQAFAGDKIAREVTDVAAGIELIHMATLLHDDIIDHAPLRRNEPSPLAKYGASNTLLSGDFLLVRAFALCSHLPRVIIDATEKSCIQLTEGEIMEISIPLSSHTLESSIEIARKKTAALFALATFSAAALTELPAACAEKLRMFGESLGIAFQVLDDVLDVVSTEDVLGKKSGTDITEQKPSTVNMLWLNSGDMLAKSTLLSKQAPGEDAVKKALAAIKESKIIEKARGLARNYAAAAKGYLEQAAALAPIQSRTALADLHLILDYTVERLG
jgi:octaprenyl-diphosphate synthase